MIVNFLAKGSLKDVFQQHINDAKRAVTSTIVSVTTKLKEDYRSQVRSTFKSRKLPTTWQQTNFPKRGESMGAAGLVFNRAPDLILYFNQKRVITPRKGKYLIIPTSYNIARSIGSGGPKYKVSPAQMSQAKGNFVIKIGPNKSLWCLPVRSEVSSNSRGRRIRTLVTTAGNKVGTAKDRLRRVRSKQLRDQGFVPMFILVRTLSFEKRLDLDGPLKRADNAIAPQIVSRWRFGVGKPVISSRR